MENTKKKIGVVTAARSEYGLLKWFLKDIKNSDKLTLQLFVTGGHLSKEQGYTIEEIERDNMPITERVDGHLVTSTKALMAASMGEMAKGFSQVFEKYNPDYLVVLGDRYELLPICSTALIMGIPVIHINGGDVTTEIIDNEIRNAVTMLATYHFVGTEEARQNVIRMRGTKENIWRVGEPGLDAFYHIKRQSRKELALYLGLDSNKKWVLITYHAETKKSLDDNLAAVKACMDALLGLKDFQIVVTYANADFGGSQINAYLEEVGKNFSNKVTVVSSLGQERYISLMQEVVFVLGNSSSGITETTFLGIPTINVGDRQKGRHQCKNIIQTGTSLKEIEAAIAKIGTPFYVSEVDKMYWGDGHAAKKMLKILETEIG